MYPGFVLGIELITKGHDGSSNILLPAVKVEHIPLLTHLPNTLTRSVVQACNLVPFAGDTPVICETPAGLVSWKSMKLSRDA